MADEPQTTEPHRTRCAALDGRWCYREACDSDLGCIEVRRSTDSRTTNDFPRLGINTEELAAWTASALEAAFEAKNELGAVNWGDLGIADIEYRLSMLYAGDRPSCHVLIEEASPECGLAIWLYERLDRDKFPNTYFECEW